VTSLLERAVELDRLTEGLGQARAGQGRFACVLGPTGIGKTRILQAAQERATQEGMCVLTARGAVLEREYPFSVVRQLFGPVVDRAGDAELARLLSGSAELARRALDDESSELYDPHPAQTTRATLHGLHRFLANLSARDPILLAVDDAHWADAASLQWLAYLVCRVEPLNVAVFLAAGRTKHPAQRTFLQEIASDSGVEKLRPRPLSDEAVGTLIVRDLGAEPSPAFASACRDATGGNPFLLGALMTELSALGMQPTAEQADRVPALGPQAVADSVVRRLHGLPSEVETVAHACAILGAGARAEQIASLTGLGPKAVRRAIDRLVQREILVSAEVVEFRHSIIQTAIYGDLGLVGRTEGHRRAAEMLRAEGAPSSQAAAHLLAAPPSGSEWALAVLLEAARHAQARGAPKEAATHLRRALDEPPGDELRVTITHELGAMELRLGNHEGFDLLQSALDMSDDPVERGRIALTLARGLASHARTAEALEILDAAIRELGDRDRALAGALQAELVGQAMSDLATNALADEQLAELQASDPQAVIDNPRLGAILAIHAICDAVSESDAREAREKTDAAVREAHAAELQDVGILVFLGVALTWSEQFDRAQRLWARVRAEAEREGSALGLAMSACFESDAALRIGDVARAEGGARATVEFVAREGWGPDALSFPLTFLVEALVERGLADEAMSQLATADMLDDLPEFWGYTPLLAARARLHLAEHRPWPAIDDLRECGRRTVAWGIDNPAVIPWRGALARALVEVGEDAEARRLAEEELDVARRVGWPRALGMALHSSGIALGSEAGRERLYEAVTVLEGCQAKLELARALADLGASLAAADETHEAREMLRRAVGVAHDSGATRIAGEAHDQLLAAGAKPRRLEVTGVEALTPAERRVAELAADGYTNREIADSLIVAEKTVEGHLSRIYRKLQIRARSQLSAMLF
jgi:DNA-binding CsgD family transcriptional regulator